ncbi:MAG: helix-hairpin-helix domain-containing protein [Phycisphaerae bacterium]|nr:helix-hairpin-helix domain-containing protein [Phycisphaerae bacterium]
MTEPDSTQRRAWLSVERGAVLLLVLLTVAFAGCWWTRRGGWVRQPDAAHVAPVGDYANKIDPNTASWQTLSCLPGIGEKLAGDIVAYRGEWAGHLPPFTQPDDLLKVKSKGRGRGLSPRTIEQLTPFLAFPATQREN